MDKCPSCKRKFECIGRHYGKGNCERPPIDSQMKEIFEGLLCGDGSVSWARNKDYATFSLGMTNKKFLNWFNEKGGLFTNGVNMSVSAKEQLKSSKKSGWANDDSDIENYNDLYRTRTIQHAYFVELRKRFYPDGEKRIPADLKLTPIKMKMWYISDGTLGFSPKGNRETRQVNISTYSESERLNEIKHIFDSAGFDAQITTNKGIRFRHNDSNEILKWMGKAPPGFEYKWATDVYEWNEKRGKVYPS